MSACCPADVKSIIKVSSDGTVTAQYLDMRVSPPILMTQAAWDAETRVKCPETETDWEKVCLQPIGNTDAALIVSGEKMIAQTITYSDVQGTINAVTRSAPLFYLEDGTDVTATHEVVSCPEPIVVESGYCVAP
jgi:hypothetical protein